NNYFGIDEEYDTVNGSMYFDNLSDVKNYCDDIVCFYSDNDPYVKYEVEKEFADTLGAKQILMPGSGHINSESGYDTFEEILGYI
ncbi:MAG: alpha/beta hydrolase, partial [Clostridia bacterium]|nr:alpha/beta hydrolase [Clostridia bacterium]